MKWKEGLSVSTNLPRTNRIRLTPYSHPKETGHTLEIHCKSVANKARELCQGINLNCETTAYYAGLLHDIGKINPWYQIVFHTQGKRYLVGNNIHFTNRETLRRQNYNLGSISRYAQIHSVLSAWAADKLLDGNTHGLSDKQIMQALCVIEGHHTNLDRAVVLSPRVNSNCSLHTPPDNHFRNSQLDMAAELPRFSQEVSGNEYANLTWNICFNEFEDPVSVQDELLSTNTEYIMDFLETGIVFSALLQADRGFFLHDKPGTNPFPRRNQAWDTPRFNIHFDTDALATAQGALTQLRNQFQDNALNTHNFAAGVTVIHAPTGIGKTKVFLDLVNRYSQNNNFERVFYFSPLLALTDDFEQKVRLVAPNSLAHIIMYSSLYSASLIELQEAREQGEPSEYHKDFLYYSFNKKFIIATTQRLLMMIYDNSVSSKMKLLSLKNSLLIVDEVQTLPKFLIPNFVEILRQIAVQLNSKILLVSATIPDELHRQNLPTTSPTANLQTAYLNATSKRIRYENQLPQDTVLEQELLLLRQNNQGRKLLVMANTRRKARDIFENNANLGPYYITSGIKKGNRLRIINEIEEDTVTVSTQGIEAGVDISFSSIYREVAPLDSIVQVMGRLDREGRNPNATLTVYRNQPSPANPGDEWIPYTQLEWEESHNRIQQIQNSQDLYAELPRYYRHIAVTDQRSINLANELRRHMTRLDFPQVWEFVRRFIGDTRQETVYIPEDHEWDEVKANLLNERTRRDFQKRYVTLTANLPGTPRRLGIEDMFDPDLMEHNMLLPLRNRLTDVYDDDIGLDIWLPR